MFASFSLEFDLDYKVNIEIQGLSSTDCNFQGLSTFKVHVNPVLCYPKKKKNKWNYTYPKLKNCVQ